MFLPVCYGPWEIKPCTWSSAAQAISFNCFLFTSWFIGPFYPYFWDYKFFSVVYVDFDSVL